MLVYIDQVDDSSGGAGAWDESFVRSGTARSVAEGTRRAIVATRWPVFIQTDVSPRGQMGTRRMLPILLRSRRRATRHPEIAANA
jgi:hypothetical protein